jgi:ferredoxin
LNEYKISCKEGDILLDCINEVGLPDISVFGVCNKQLACHSCSVHILSHYDKLPKPSEEEMDVHSELGEIYREKSTRMSCQIVVTKEMEGMTIEIPRSAFFLLNDDIKFNEKESSEIKKIK